MRRKSDLNVAITLGYGPASVKIDINKNDKIDDTGILETTQNRPLLESAVDRVKAIGMKNFDKIASHPTFGDKFFDDDDFDF